MRAPEYTNREIQYIKQCAAVGMRIPEIMPYLEKEGFPGRTIRSIKEKCRKMGIRILVSNRAWSKKEDSILFTNRHLGTKAIMGILKTAGYNRTPQSIYERAKHLGLKIKAVRKDGWNAEEVSIIKTIYPIKGATGVKSALKAKGYNRTINSIHSKRTLLGLSVQPEKLLELRDKVNKMRGLQQRIKAGKDLHALNI